MNWQILKVWMSGVILGSFLLSSLAFAAEPADLQNPTPEEALAVANQYKTMSQTISKQGGTITALGESYSAVNFTLASKIKSLINVIELQRKHFADLVVNEMTTNVASSEKLDAIIANLEEGRKSLASMIYPELDVPNLAVKPADQQKVATSFNVFVNN